VCTQATGQFAHQLLVRVHTAHHILDVVHTIASCPCANQLLVSLHTSYWSVQYAHQLLVSLHFSYWAVCSSATGQFALQLLVSLHTSYWYAHPATGQCALQPAGPCANQLVSVDISDQHTHKLLVSMHMHTSCWSAYAPDIIDFDTKVLSVTLELCIGGKQF
jgi:hypothetical protein